uniref:mRNA export factor n=1 Tax=Rhizochromulina marina TaxID=1034831 RepID=A0A7S2R535_9STRA|mmetsp:Transcript_1104/g.3535  ORF Transcript_1104/g.3535 Transcript_1104/m.3535 type:complete len:375 (+) Transcript_1104:42-1166(+)|eukprot:CAMPEP_0118974260 /NCGR_PEP_ID=MMETSP1173-20130426/11156_1 /TAXON_ID=1034831 /ORGANISM="Rhizochromulina marina cf, Strain CCMP1243" /LENGTH=374 /DNA_ID=CAMNT_0006923973 /DNA_START=30 /DNA_END=1154 /DNA_ORIENTATION=-
MWGAQQPQAQALDFKVPGPPHDSISSLAMSSTGILMAGAWDNSLRCWQVQKQGNQVMANPAAQAAHDAPVLSCCFSTDGAYAFSGGADNSVRMWQLGAQPAPVRLGAHDAPVKSVHWVNELNMLVTGGWDNTVRFWDVRQSKEALKLQLDGKVYCMDVKFPYMAVSTSNLSAPEQGELNFPSPAVHLYSLNQQSPLLHGNKPIKLSLKHQTRCISLFSGGHVGFGVGSAEGRVEIKDLHEPHNKKKNFAFKCHRFKDRNRSNPHAKIEYSVVYPVNEICWHPNGCFATVGSDGVFNFWDKNEKQRLKEFKLGEGCRAGQANQAISACCFNPQGDIFAYAMSYDWLKGREGHNPSNEIYLHPVLGPEITPPKKQR